MPQILTIQLQFKLAYISIQAVSYNFQILVRKIAIKLNLLKSQRKQVKPSFTNYQPQWSLKLKTSFKEEKIIMIFLNLKMRNFSNIFLDV